MEYFNNLQYWHWIAFGSVLIMLEIFLPSAIFLWPGLAAVITGAISFVEPELSPMFLLLLWAVLSVLLAMGWQSYKKTRQGDTPRSTINRRGEQYVGRHFTLNHDIINGSGELHVDDTRWKIISNTDLSSGVRVKVIAVEGTSLRVEEYIS